MKNDLKSMALPALACILVAPLGLAGISAATAEPAPGSSVIVPLAQVDRSSMTVPLAPAPSPLTIAKAHASRSTLAVLVDGLMDTNLGKPSSYAEDCLARTVYFETRGEPLEGQLAVAEVVLNRTRHSDFANNVCDVVRQPYQFSFVSKGVIPNPDASSRAWKRSMAIAHIAMNKLTHSRASTALYFHADYVSPSWRHAFNRKATLGRHIFYTEVAQS